MKLNAKTDFLYRTLIFVALNPGRLVSSREIAEAYGLSHHHVSKVCQDLIQHGYLNSQRGRGGGVTLAKEPEDIHLGELLDLGKLKPTIIDCENGVGGPCIISPACRLKGIFAEAQRAFIEVMNSHTLAEVISKPGLHKLFESDQS